MNYTKGEWKITECAMQTYDEPIQHFLITSDSREFGGRTLADIGLWRDFLEDMVRANAQLIASAPDLYEACREALTLIEPYIEGYDALNLANQAYNKLKQALAKVEGK